MDTGLVGWILATVAFAGLYGAVKNKPWLSVLTSAVNPSANVPASITAPLGNASGTGDPAAVGSAGSPVAYARAQLGKPYKWGAAGPDSFDCSGLTMRAYDTVGISLPHNSAMQLIATKGTEIGLTDHPPAGALCFYGTPPHHVGISLGDGTMISAPHTGDVVKVSSIPGFGRDFSHVTVPLNGHHSGTASGKGKAI